MAVVAVCSITPAALWAVTFSPPDAAERIPQFILAALVVGTPMAIAAALIVHRFRAGPVGRDWPERILDDSTAGLSDSGADWGAAMRAELASISGRPARRRFAIGCAISAFRLANSPLAATRGGRLDGPLRSGHVCGVTRLAGGGQKRDHGIHAAHAGGRVVRTGPCNGTDARARSSPGL